MTVCVIMFLSNNSKALINWYTDPLRIEIELAGWSMTDSSLNTARKVNEVYIFQSQLEF